MQFFNDVGIENFSLISFKTYVDECMNNIAITRIHSIFCSSFPETHLNSF